MAKRQTQKKKDNDELIIKIIASVIIIVVLLVAVFRLGIIGIILNNLLRYIFGELYLVTVLSIIFLCLYLTILHEKFKLSKKVLAGIIIVNIAVLLAFAIFEADGSVGLGVFEKYFSYDAHLFEENALNYGGGIIGVFIYAGFSALLGRAGSIIFTIALFVIAAILIVPLDTYARLFLKAKDKKEDLIAFQKERRQKKDIKKDTYLDVINDDQVPIVQTNSAFIDVDNERKKEIKKDEIKEEAINASSSETRTIKKSRGFGAYHLPPITVFDDVQNAKVSSINRSSADVKGKKVIEILRNFGIDATLIATHIGPSVTKFELKPDSSVKVNKIQNISDNIKMELAARDIRIEAPIPGRSAVGIEIPNVEPVAVRMRELIKSEPNDKEKKLVVYLGKDLMGKVVTCEIDKMPHLLIAGATGSGKSVCINAIISSLIYRTSPKDVKLVLVDPKKVEFTPYHDIPNLLWPVITDATMANNMLKKIVVMMDERYELFSSAGVRDIKTYNSTVDSFNAKNDDPEKMMVRLPYIVIIIDELADLMMISGKEVEASIQRITQLARASGIHLIVATQRPSTDVITGIIKSNIPSRISFAVASSIDSRTILDQTGAERLLGNGDMLYSPTGSTSPIRVQGVYVTDKEVKAITDYAKSQAKPDYDDTYFEFLNIERDASNIAGTSKGERDSLYEEVKEYVIDVQKASTSLLQRRFGIGYNRAAGLIESLEENGIIGPSNGSRPREVFAKKDDTTDTKE